MNMNMIIRFRYSSRKDPIVVPYAAGKDIAMAKNSQNQSKTIAIEGYGVFELQTITSVEPTVELTREQVTNASANRRAANSTQSNTADAIQARINAIYAGSRYTHSMEFCKKHKIENIRALAQQKANMALLEQCNEAWAVAYPEDAKVLRDYGLIIF